MSLILIAILCSCFVGNGVTDWRVTDHYTCAFLEAIDYTENCYECEFASLERASDMTLGDSWGSEYKDQEKNGISLILIQSQKGKELLSMSKMELKDVDLDNAIAYNHQLSHPSVKSSKRARFFKFMKKGVSFKVTTFMVLPKIILKQKVKGILVKLLIIRWLFMGNLLPWIPIRYKLSKITNKANNKWLT